MWGADFCLSERSQATPPLGSKVKGHDAMLQLENAILIIIIMLYRHPRACLHVYVHVFAGFLNGRFLPHHPPPPPIWCGGRFGSHLMGDIYRGKGVHDTAAIIINVQLYLLHCGKHKVS